MVSKLLVSALVATTALVSAQSTTSLCASATITVDSAAAATALSSCQTIPGSVLIGTNTGSTINLEGPKAIGGDLTMVNNGQIVTLTSSSIASIGGTFTLNNITLLSNLDFSALNSVKAIQWQSLPQLERLGFSSNGVSKVSTVVISDTYLNSLTGLSILTVDTMNINNNKRLTEYTSQLVNLTTLLQFQANGQGLKVDMPSLTTAANLTIQDVGAFTVPLLKTARDLRFDSNTLTSFVAPNLTETSGDISFIDNAKLTNISFPVLKTIGGGLTIANNTALQKIDGFPKMETVGAVKLRGNFSAVALPALRNAKGAFDIQSTTDISTSCSVFDAMQPGKGGQIQGKYNCDSNEENANVGNNTGGSGPGSGTNSQGTRQSTSFAILGLALVAGAVTSFL